MHTSSPPHGLGAQGVYGRLRGTAFDSMGAAVGARVSLVGTTISAITDPAGRFDLDHVPAGVYLVRAEEAGSAPGEVEGVRVVSGATTGVAIRLGRRTVAAAGGATLGLALRQAEARWGNGDGFYDTGEINRAFGAWYDSLYGTWSFDGPARTARVGIEIAL